MIKRINRWRIRPDHKEEDRADFEKHIERLKKEEKEEVLSIEDKKDHIIFELK